MGAVAARNDFATSLSRFIFRGSSQQAIAYSPTSVIACGMCFAVVIAMLRFSPLALALALITPLAGCLGGEEAAEEDLCSPDGQVSLASLELGAPEDSFAALADGAEMEMQYGLQGGMMFFFRMRAQGTDVPTCMNVRIELIDSDGTVYSDTDVPVRFSETSGEGALLSAFTPVVLFETGAYDGKTATLRAGIGDAEALRSVLLREPSDS